MNERVEKFRQQLQKELGLTVGPKIRFLRSSWCTKNFGRRRPPNINGC